MAQVAGPFPMSAIEHAVFAVTAVAGGDRVSARRHIARAQQTRAIGRRERQVVEIAALVVAGARARADGLALEHTAEFPGDAELLACVAPPGDGCPPLRA